MNIQTPSYFVLYIILREIRDSNDSNVQQLLNKYKKVGEIPLSKGNH